MRVLPEGRYRTYGLPRFDDPNFVNWVDYNKVLLATNPNDVVTRIGELSEGKPIFFVSAPGYTQAGDTCKAIRLVLNRNLVHRTVVAGDPKTYFQSLTLTEYSMTGTFPQ